MRLFEGDLNKWRLRKGPYGSDDSMKDGGVFQIPYKDTNTMLFVIATSGNPPLLGTEIWEHVSARAFDDAKSASPKERTPTWTHEWIISRVRGDLCPPKRPRSRKGQNNQRQATASK